MNTVLPVLAWALVELGELEESHELLARAEACARGRDDRLTLVDLLWVRALLNVRQNHSQRAASILREARALCRAMPYLYGEVRVLYAYGLLHAQRGERVRTHVCLGAALALCAQLGERRYAERIVQTLLELSALPLRQPQHR